MRTRIIPDVQDHRPLLSRNPVVCASATALGVALLGSSETDSRFLRYSDTTPKKLTPQDLLYTLNPMQVSMYNRVSKGIANYSAQQLASMNSYEQQKVERDHKRFKHLLHRLRIDLLPETKLIQAMIPLSPPLGERWRDYDIDELPLRKPHPTTAQIIAVLMENGLLPENFYTLEPSSLFN